jgi:outer membrane protein
VNEARATIASLEAQRGGLRLGVQVEVERARLAVEAAKAVVLAAAEAVASARERLRLAEGRYQSGVGSVIELSDAQLGLTSALAQQVQADFSLASARATLIRALGLPG